MQPGISPSRIGDVVANQIRCGAPQTMRQLCPGCSKIVPRAATQCERCKTTFVPVTEGYVQIIGVRERATPR